ncbi:Uncharacterised protein [Escherichia coli]|nr:Uncharacterised protein [Escherichia coli]
MLSGLAGDGFIFVFWPPVFYILSLFFVLAILGAFKWAVFWLGGILCVITWYHLDHQLWTPQNLTIPVITATWILGLLAEPLMELLNKTMPWHKLLVPEPADESTENSSEISQ